MIRNFLSCVPFVLLNLRAADVPATGSPAAAPEWAPSDKAPELTGDSLEEKNASALTIIGDFFKKLGTALKDFKALQTEKQNLQTQFDAATEGWEKEKTEHTATKGLLSTEQTQHTATKASLTKAETNVTRLEKLCGLHGIDKDQAISAAKTGGQGDLAAEYQDLKKKEDKGEVKRGTASKFYNKNKKEIDAAIA